MRSRIRQRPFNLSQQRLLEDVQPDQRHGNRQRPKSVDTKQQALIYTRFGSVCFVLGLMGFCLLQGFTFLVIDHMTSKADDYNSMDDDSIGFVSLLRPFRKFWTLLSDYTSSRTPFLPSFREQDQQPILIIGGSDGSGTRAVVDTIRELGAVVVADDRETFDVHAQSLFQHQGWPGLVYAVLNFTHTADYEWDDLIRLSSQEHMDHIETETKFLLRELKTKYDLNKRFHRRSYLDRLESKGDYKPSKGLSHQRHKGRAFLSHHTPGEAPAVLRPTTFPALANGISFVIKAPVSMLVLPIFCRLYKSASGKPIKFLHVIRDGRDVALSSNQSPVLKFYQSMYKDYQQREEKFSKSLWNVRAIQLWNDWNTAVHEWAMRHVSKHDEVVDYMWIRSEDLLPGSPKRFESLLALSHFTGSTLTPEKLCALSGQEARDYGKSVEHKELPPNPQDVNIGERWKQQMQGREKAPKIRKIYPRRQLQEVSGLPPKVVASSFIGDFKTWKGLVENMLNKTMQDTKKYVLDGLIVHGEDLAKQWHLNHFDSQAEELKESVTKKEILDLTQKLRVQLQESRLYAHNKRQVDRPGNPDVKKRYGKWQGVLSNNTELAKYFYSEGKDGLELFGYHPEKEIHYLAMDILQEIGQCVHGRLELVHGQDNRSEH